MSNAVGFGEGDLIHVDGNAFLVEEVLGSGGMGTAYLVRDKKLDERMVLKVIHAELARTRPDVRERFLREARAISKVKHPNIVHVTGLWELKDEWRSPAYSMEALDGVSLADAITDGPADAHRALHIVYQVLAALDAMHRRGIVHRDMKPQNIILYKDEGRGEWLVKVLDFGVIRLIADEVTFTGFIGTFAYASDRQLAGKLAEPADDVWAVFMILYELLTGVHAFAELGLGKDGAVARIGKRARPLRDHGLDLPEVQEILDKALNVRPSDRFVEAFEALQAVKRVMKKHSPKAPPKAITTQDRRPAEDPITEAHLSPTHPDVLPAWLVDLRAQLSTPQVSVRSGDSVVDERAPTTPAPLRHAERSKPPTVDERLTAPSPKRAEAGVHGGATIEERRPEDRVEIVEPKVDPRKLPTKLPSETPPMPDAKSVEYVPRSAPQVPALDSTGARKQGPPIFLLVRKFETVEHGSFLLDEYPIVLGREAPSTLLLEHRGMSKEHARIDFDGERFLLTDLASTNGTFVERGEKRLRLEPKQPIELGDKEKMYFGPLYAFAYLGTKRTREQMVLLVQADQQAIARTQKRQRGEKGDRTPRFGILGLRDLTLAGWLYLLMGLALVSGMFWLVMRYWR